MKNLLTAGLLGSIICLSSCGNDNQSNNDGAKQTITHALGSTEVPQNVSKVAILDFGNLETANEMGVRTIAFPKNIGFPSHLASFKNDASIVDVGTLKEINFEKLHAAKPELIIIASRLQKSYDELSKIAPTVYLELDYSKFDTSLKENIQTLGKMFNKNQAADSLYNLIQEKIATVKSKADNMNQKAMILMYNNGKFSTYGPGSRFGIIYDVLGLKPSTSVEHNDARHGKAISNEFILSNNPDIIFLIDRGVAVDGQAADKSVIENAFIQKTNAFKNGKIIYLDPQTWYLSGNGVTSLLKMIDDIDKSIQ